MPEQKKKNKQTKKQTNRKTKQNAKHSLFFRTKSVIYCKTGFGIQIVQGLKEKTEIDPVPSRSLVGKLTRTDDVTQTIVVTITPFPSSLTFKHSLLTTI